jgi:adenylyl-sulfate kinase
MESKVLHLYGYPCSGKTTIGTELAKYLNAVVLDGDDVRASLYNDLGFTKEDRIENLRRFGALSEFLNRQGFNVIICTVAPHAECRDIVKDHVENYHSIFVNTPLETCKERDTKGMYAKAMKGEMYNFTGVHSDIEIGDPDIVVEPDELEKQVQFILSSI